MQLTIAGHRFLEFAIETMDRLSQTQAEIYESMMAPGTTRVSIASTQSVMRHFTGRMLAPFHEAYPDIILTLQQANRVLMEELVLSGRAEIGMRSGPNISPDFDQVFFFDDNLVLIVPSQMKTSIEALITHKVSSLDSIPMISWSRRSAERERGLVSQWAEEMEVKLNIVAEVDDVDTGIEAVAAGLGCAVVPAYSLRDSLAPNDVVVAQDIWQPVVLKYYIVYKRGQELSSAAQAFVDFALAWIKTPNAIGPVDYDVG